MTVSEKVAYLKGLTQGLELDENDKIVKVLNAIVDTLDEVAEAMGELELDVVDIIQTSGTPGVGGGGGENELPPAPIIPQIDNSF